MANVSQGHGAAVVGPRLFERFVITGSEAGGIINAVRYSYASPPNPSFERTRTLGSACVPSPEAFDLQFSNIPMINLRMEFNSTCAFISSTEAESSLKPPLQPIQTPLLIWGGMPEDFHTLLLQRSILGVEAYLPGALVHTSAKVGNVSAELVAKLKNPFSFRAKSAVANIYHHAPAAVHTELSLQHLDKDLCARTLVFYLEVRNPVFHGRQLEKPKIEGIRDAFQHMARLYEWIDYWCSPEKLLTGGGFLAGVRARYPQAGH